MTAAAALNMALFVIGQIGANILVKWGSQSDDRFWWGWAWSNLVHVVSIFFYANAFRLMSGQANLVHILCNAFIFTGIQLSFWLLFQGKLSPAQWLAMAGMLLCMVIFSRGAPANGDSDSSAPSPPLAGGGAVGQADEPSAAITAGEAAR